MKKIWELYENMNEVVYVSDMDTYDIIYMNKKARKQHNINSLEELKGKKCYEVLQNCSSLCAICNNSKLKADSFYEWRYFNPIFKKSFLLKDTMIYENNKRYRMEIAIDISSHEIHKKTIRDYINNERIVNEGLYLALSSTDPEKSIQLLIEHIGRAIKCERVYIFEGTLGKQFDNTYEWCANGFATMKDSFKNMIFNYENYSSLFKENKTVVINNAEDIKRELPDIYSYMLKNNVHSLVAIPLTYNNEITGFFLILNPPEDSLSNISTLFMIIGHFIVCLIRRRILFKRLENLSFYDNLTSLGNRHLMNDYIAEINHSKSIGIVFCDVTGLKRINDTLGHKAGDELLLRACECIKKSFSEYAQFRLGGDEFLVICVGIEEDELSKRIILLNNCMAENSVLMAIGYIWRPNSNGNINDFILEADRLMYENKRKHYENLK